MKTLNYWIVALMALSFSMTVVSCDEDVDTNNTEQAKAVAGTYKGYSIGNSKMFSDYLMGDQATTTITANEDGTINLVYKSGAGDFTLNNLKVSSKSFSGVGEVALAMSGGKAANYEYTLEGSVNDSKVLTLKVNLPVPMGGLNVDFIQGETPIAYRVAATYKYGSKLSLKVGAQTFGPTTEGKAIIKRVSATTVNITMSGFDKIASMPMSMADFTISGVNVTAKADGGYSLSLGEFESKTGETIINGKSLNGTVATNGTADITVVFAPGAMPMSITAVFTGSNTPSRAQ